MIHSVLGAVDYEIRDFKRGILECIERHQNISNHVTNHPVAIEKFKKEFDFAAHYYMKRVMEQLDCSLDAINKCLAEKITQSDKRMEK